MGNLDLQVSIAKEKILDKVMSNLSIPQCGVGHHCLLASLLFHVLPTRHTRIPWLSSQDTEKAEAVTEFNLNAFTYTSLQRNKEPFLVSSQGSQLFLQF